LIILGTTRHHKAAGKRPRQACGWLVGVDRCLPYRILLQEGKKEFAAIEAFIAEREAE
jgi:hypothetical protein